MSSCCERSERRLNVCDRVKCNLFLFFFKFLNPNKMSDTDRSSDDDDYLERKMSQHQELPSGDESEEEDDDFEDIPDVEELQEILKELNLKSGSREKKDWIHKMLEFYNEVEPEFENDERIINECIHWLKKC